MTRYERLAEEAGVILCQKDRCAYAIASGTVHFPRERFSYTGAFQLLLLAYSARFTKSNMLHWQDRWDRVLWVMAIARKAQVRLPKRVWEMERARMREAISRYKRASEVRARHEISELTAAERWAAR